MKFKFKDYFSEDSEEYSKFRPTYPPELFAYLASVSNQHQKAWDCATGTGQSAIMLSKYYSEVIATDASRTQISKATEKQGVTYQVSAAEHSHIERDSVDLITVAQALHWFNIGKFSIEVNRVLKSKGILSIWSYNLLSIQEDIDKEVAFLYRNILGEYWPEERKMVESGYKDIQLPFTEIKAPSFNMSADWDLRQLMGYLCTWSATKKYQNKHGVNAIEKVYPRLANIWGDPKRMLSINWPLTIRLWRKHTSGSA